MPHAPRTLIELERVAEELERSRRADKQVAEYPAFREFALRYFDDPVAFASDILGMELTDYQAEALEELVQYRRLSVRSGHGSGKTRLISVAAIWFMLTRDGAEVKWKVAITASVERQLVHIVYPEILDVLKMVNWGLVGRPALGELGHEIYSSYIDLSYGRLLIIATDDPAKLEGVHADQVLWILDEAKAIEVSYWEAIEGAFSADGAGDQRAYALATSTPGDSSGRFYDIHKRMPGTDHWRTMHWTLDRAIAAGRTSLEWVEQKRAEWGEKHPIYQRRVLGEFCDDLGESVIPLSAVEASQRRWLQLSALEALRDEPFTCLGVDVAAGGGDKSVVAIRHGNVIAELRYYDTDTMVLAGAVAGLLTKYGTGYAVIDIAGIGNGVMHRLREQKFEIVAFHAQYKTERRDQTGELGFHDARAGAWWNLREGLLNNELVVPPDDHVDSRESLTNDLVCAHWEILSNGKVAVESKKLIKRRLGRSPDAGDAVAMAFWEQELPGGTFMLPPLHIDQRRPDKESAATRAEEHLREWGAKWRDGEV